MVVIATVAPLLYLVFRAAEADGAMMRDVILRARNLDLLVNTIGLAAAVVVSSIVVALPLAWLTTSTDLRGRFAVTVIALLPLAAPGYVLAYGLLSLSSPVGPLAELFGVTFARFSGFWGALVTLTIYNSPFMFLNLRAALLERNPTLSEAARSLGAGPIRRFTRVTLPQLWPAVLSGTLIVALYVFGDFGVVSLMRFETISYAIFLQYLAAFDRVYAAWLALMLIGFAVALLAVEFIVLRDFTITRSARTTRPASKRTRLGVWKWPAYAFVAGVLVFSTLVPNSVFLYWLARRATTLDYGAIASALGDSLVVSAPAALAATALAVPIAFIEHRYGSKTAHIMGRSVYLGYALPPLALALGLIFLVLRAAPWMYQTGLLLVIAYVVHFLAQAVGPVRTTLFVATPTIEEASRTLGVGAFGTLRRVTLPLLRPGLIAAAAMVFLSAIKELPLTYLLAPLDFQSLALKVYGFTTEAMFAEAAPYALAIVALSMVLVGVLFRHSSEFK